VRRALTLAHRELRDIVRERTIVMAVLVQLFVAAFSAFLAVGLLALYDPGAVGVSPDMRIAYHGEGDFDEVLGSVDGIEVVGMDFEEAHDAFEAGRVSAVVGEYDPGDDEPRLVTATVPEDEVVTSLLVTELKSAFETYEQQLREERDQRLEHPLTYATTDAEPSVAALLVVVLPF
jgi:hypothetical protein